MAINNPNNQKPQQKKAAGFVNLDRVLAANTGNRLGQTIGTGIQTGAQGLQQKLGEVKSGFLQESEQKNLASDVNKRAATEALQNIGSGQTNVTDEQAKQFGTFLAGKYAGPRELDSTKTAQIGAKAQELQGFGQALGSQGDKSQVLTAFASQGKGPYSAGEKRLDSFLLGKGPNAGELQKAQQQTRGLTRQVNREQDTARQIGQLREGQASQFAQDVGGQITSQKTGIEGAVGSEFERLSGEQGKLYDTIKSKLDKGELLNPEERQLLGLADPIGDIGNKMPGLPGQQAPLMDIFNLDATKFLNKADLSKGNVASAVQKAQLDALSKLSQKDIKDFTDIDTKAGQFDPNKPVTFDREKLKKDADIVRQQYESELNRGLGLSLGQQLEDAPNSILGSVVGGLTLGGLGGAIAGNAVENLASGPSKNYSLYNFEDTLSGMPNIANMNYQQAMDAISNYERKIEPFKKYVEQGRTESKTKYNNLKGAYDDLIPRINAAKQQLAQYKQNLDKQYGIGRKI